MAFEDWSDEDLTKIQSRTLVSGSFQDVVTPEHALHMSRAILSAEAVVLRGMHGEFLGDAPVVSRVNCMPQLAAEILHEFLSA